MLPVEQSVLQKFSGAQSAVVDCRPGVQGLVPLSNRFDAEKFGLTPSGAVR
jgi:hypothetical protein